MSPATGWVTRLAVAVAERGKCAGSDAPDAWFPIESVSATASLREAAAVHAQALCAGCPVVGDCLALALIRGEEYGIWGGTTPHERQDLLHGHRHGRVVAVQLSLWPSEDASGDAA